MHPQGLEDAHNIMSAVRQIDESSHIWNDDDLGIDT